MLPLKERVERDTPAASKTSTPCPRRAVAGGPGRKYFFGGFNTIATLYTLYSTAVSFKIGGFKLKAKS